MIDTATADKWAHDLLDAWTSNTPKPTRELPSLSTDDAYHVQKQLVALRDGEIVGFKAGLTNGSIQKKHGSNEPAGGVLLADTRFFSGVTFSLGDFTSPRIETEVAFIVGADIDGPIDVEDLKSHLSCWLPMVELVDIGFSSPPVLTDLIASNVVASRCVQSDFRHDVNTANDAALCLYKDGVPLHEGKATDALGDQLQAARWIVNHMLAQGYTVNAGHVLMTGALGVTHAAEVGRYRADYGDFGAVEFGFEP